MFYLWLCPLASLCALVSPPDNGWKEPPEAAGEPGELRNSRTLEGEGLGTCAGFQRVRREPRHCLFTFSTSYITSLSLGFLTGKRGRITAQTC